MQHPQAGALCLIAVYTDSRSRRSRRRRCRRHRRRRAASSGN